MKKVIYNFLVFSFAVIILGFPSVLAYNEKVSACPKDICTAITDDLPDRATGIDPNTKVELGFGVFSKTTKQAPACEGSKKIFHVARRYTVRSGDDYEYIAPAEGHVFSYTFNSGQYGQRHRYVGVFYCWTKSLGTDKSGVNGMFANKDSKGQDQAWLTHLFDQTTRMAPQLPVNGSKDQTTTKNTSKTVSLNFGNPLHSENISDLIDTIMRWLRIIVLPIAVIVIVISGIIMMYSRGDPGKFATGKKMLIWAVVGLAVILIGEGFTKLIESIINLKNR